MGGLGEEHRQYLELEETHNILWQYDVSAYTLRGMGIEVNTANEQESRPTESAWRDAG